MKIQELAESAHGQTTGKWWDMDVPALERFAAMVLEEAAKECDKRAHAGDAGALMAARAIRALKGAEE